LGSDIPDKASRGPQPLATLVKSELAKWTPIINSANIKVDKVASLPVFRKGVHSVLSG